MSEASNARPISHLAVWIGAIVGLILFYFLSFPWVTAFTYKHSVGFSWQQRYDAPWNYVHDHSPFDASMDKYLTWCFAESGVSPVLWQLNDGPIILSSDIKPIPNYHPHPPLHH